MYRFWDLERFFCIGMYCVYVVSLHTESTDSVIHCISHLYPNAIQAQGGMGRNSLPQGTCRESGACRPSVVHIHVATCNSIIHDEALGSSSSAMSLSTSYCEALACNWNTPKKCPSCPPACDSIQCTSTARMKLFTVFVQEFSGWRFSACTSNTFCMVHSRVSHNLKSVEQVYSCACALRMRHNAMYVPPRTYVSSAVSQHFCSAATKPKS